MDCPECKKIDAELWELQNELAGAKVRAKFASGVCATEKERELSAALFLAHQIERTREKLANHRKTHHPHKGLFRIK